MGRVEGKVAFITGAARAHQLLRRPALKILQKTGKTLGFIGVAAEAPTVVGPGELSNGGAQAAGRQRGCKFGGRKPGRFLISPPLQELEHPLIEQGGVTGAGMAPPDPANTPPKAGETNQGRKQHPNESGGSDQDHGAQAGLA